MPWFVLSGSQNQCGRRRSLGNLLPERHTQHSALSFKQFTLGTFKNLNSAEEATALSGATPVGNHDLAALRGRPWSAGRFHQGSQELHPYRSAHACAELPRDPASRPPAPACLGCPPPPGGLAPCRSGNLDHSEIPLEVRDRRRRANLPAVFINLGSVSLLRESWAVSRKLCLP